MLTPRKVNTDFFKIWTHDMAYVLGFFAADGYITVNKRGGNYWCIEMNDRDLLEKIRKAVGSNHDISIRRRIRNTHACTSYRLQIGSKEMCLDLQNLGFWINKTDALSIPFVPEDFLKDFVRGYFDGDGNIWSGINHGNTSHPKPTLLLAFTSCSFLFLDALKGRLGSILGISGSLVKTKKECHRLQYSKGDSLKLYDFMYNGLTSPLFLGRKRAVFEKFIKIAAVAQR